MADRFCPTCMQLADFDADSRCPTCHQRIHRDDETRGLFHFLWRRDQERPNYDKRGTKPLWQRLARLLRFE